MIRILTELALGLRLAFTGGRRGWTRTALAAAGVAVGTALLLLGASVPTMLDARGARLDARDDHTTGAAPVPRGDTVLYAWVDFSWDGLEVRGRLMWPESERAPLPPGIPGFPADGRAYVSPALRTALAGPDGADLRRLIPYEIAGVVAPAGLSGPHELAYYAGYRDLENRYPSRLASFGAPEPSPPDRSTYLFVVLLIATVLLPVVIFIGAALRFGADARDRRLAAIRLIGADTRSTLRIAVGESLVPALIGLAAGTLLHLSARGLAGGVRLFDVSVYPADIRPVPALAVLVVAGVLVLSAAMTLLGLRGVAIEPLGVVRNAHVWHGRLWWRLLPLAAGLLLLRPAWDGDQHSEDMVGAGVVVIVIALIPLVPYVVPAVARLLPGGPVSWQLAARQLRQNPLASTRAVTGIVVAVTGAVALHTGLAAATLGRAAADDPADPAYSVLITEGIPASGAPRVQAAFAEITGVRSGTTAEYFLYDTKTRDYGGRLAIGDCAALALLATVGRCAGGDVFTVGDLPGTVTLTAGGEEFGPGRTWTVPARARPATARPFNGGPPENLLLVTTQAAPANLIADEPDRITTLLFREPGAPRDVGGKVQAVAIGIDPLSQFTAMRAEHDKFAPIRTGVNIGATLLLLLLGVGLLLDVTDRLHDRRRLLGVLGAVGAKRSTVIWSVLLQAAVPVLAGLTLAVAAGAGLGAVLMRMSQVPVQFGAAAILAPVGIGLAMVLLCATAVLLPTVRRVMNTEELRYE